MLLGMAELPVTEPPVAEPRIAEPILHVDMDAFFVEVERLEDPLLLGRPVVVGASSRRGVVASASYEARAWGVRSAMPTGIARRKCPALVIVPPRHQRYIEVSEQVFSVLRDFTPLVQELSLDEAFLDVRGLRRHYPNTMSVAEDIRDRIRSELHLPASVGAATTLYLAKVASGYAKPDGVYIVTEGDEKEFLEELDVDQLWGVGKVTRRKLADLGVTKVGELARIPLPLLRRHLGKKIGAHLHNLANGIDDRVVEPIRGAKSMSVEQTYGHDISGREVLRAQLLKQSDHLSWRLNRAGLSGLTISIKLRFPDFKTITRSETLAAPTHVAREIYQSSCRLLDRTQVEDRPVRLLGIAVSRLQVRDETRQLVVDGEERWEDLSDAVDEVRVRFGRQAVVPARLMGRDPS